MVTACGLWAFVGAPKKLLNGVLDLAALVGGKEFLDCVLWHFSDK